MGTLSELLFFYDGDPPGTGGFPSQGFQSCGALMFSLLLARISCKRNSRFAGDWYAKSGKPLFFQEIFWELTFDGIYIIRDIYYSYLLFIHWVNECCATVCPNFCGVCYIFFPSTTIHKARTMAHSTRQPLLGLLSWGPSHCWVYTESRPT